MKTQTFIRAMPSCFLEGLPYTQDYEREKSGNMQSRQSFPCHSRAKPAPKQPRTLTPLGALLPAPAGQAWNRGSRRKQKLFIKKEEKSTATTVLKY